MLILRKCSLLVLAAVLLLGAGGARAHEVEVSGMGGGHLFSDDNELGRDDGDPRSPGNALQHSGAAGINIGYFPIKRLGIELEALAIPTTLRDSGAFVMALGYRGHIVFNILTGRIRPFLLAGGGGLTSLTSGDEGLHYPNTDLMLHGGAGVKIALTQRLVLRVDGRVAFPPSIASDLFTVEGEVLVGLGGRFAFGKGAKDEPTKRPQKGRVDTTLALPPPDMDKDGIPDSKDKCADKAGIKENEGCPDVDTDQDGVVDRLDKCADKAGIKENEGCPDVDTDKDGVVDRLDKCVDKPGVEKLEGCPEPDGDGDGVLDKDDKCPDKAGVAQFGGCPDTDNDGLQDAADKCPDKAETKNNFDDADGCPDEIPSDLAQLLQPVDGIVFNKKNAVDAKKSKKALEKIVPVFKKYPTARIEVAVYADDQAQAQALAEALRSQLMSQGMGGSRLVAKGYGPPPEQPQVKPAAEPEEKGGKGKKGKKDKKPKKEKKPKKDKKGKKGKGGGVRVEFHLLPAA